ncbi:hypothetical protein C8R44DRAFT_327558 [Mycena epipterygia]|nr:hypothetical protein C8R44DRAFT_327558 [Mycena epipterygia]
MLLSYVTPSAFSIGLMRQKEFQHSLFYAEVSMWPQRDSTYPSDLIQLWDGYRYIFALIPHLRRSRNRSTPTLRFDAIYTTIFSNHPDVLLVVQIMILLPLRPYQIFRILGPTWNHHVFLPFHEFRELLELPFPEGDSPLDFLSDLRRAGDIYSDPQNAAEELVLIWISRVKELLIGGGDFWDQQSDYDSTWLADFINRWPRSPRIVFELETLDLSRLCGQMAIKPEAHKTAHHHGILHPDIHRILDWLQNFPDPPLQAIVFWEKQIEDIKRCHNKFPQAMIFTVWDEVQSTHSNSATGVGSI